MFPSSIPEEPSLPKRTFWLGPDRLNRWFNWLTIGLLTCWLLGFLLGRYYFFELFSHFYMQYKWLAIGLVFLSAIPQFFYGNQFTQSSLRIWILMLVYLIPLSPHWLSGDLSTLLQAPLGDARIVHANVLFTRDEYKTTVDLIHNQGADLYVLQEMQPHTIRLVTTKLGQEFPHWFACWSKGPCWTLVGSKTPIRVDRKLAKTRRIINLTTEIRGKTLSLVTVHPRTPVLPPWFNERNEQLTEAAWITRHNAFPTVLVGDFNITMFSPIYKDIFTDSPADIRNNQLLQAGRRTMTQPTWPSFLPFPLLPLDHVFGNTLCKPIFMWTLDQPGSDHRAIVTDLRIRNFESPF
jgi:endonuclease/exonuclease/phosphatase (EEP) superfamily protein YafD